MGFEDFLAFGYIMIIVIAVVAIWLFFRYAFKGKLKKKLISIFNAVKAYISEKIRKFVAKYSRRGDYNDEHESLFSLRRILSRFRRRLDDEDRSRYNREIPWNRLDCNRDRIRYIYRHFVMFCIGAGFSYNNKRTPNQISGDILAWNALTGKESPYLTQIYNEARYGPDEHDIDDDIVEGALEKTKEIK